MIPRANKVVWITGASSGIGEGLALSFAADGYTVAVSARRAEPLQHMAASTHGNGRILAYPLDTTNNDDVRAVIAKIIRDLGRIDLAILNAGTYKPDDAENLDMPAIEEHFRINVLGTMHCLMALVPVLHNKGGAHVAITSSVAGYRGLPRGVGYGGTKAALINMAEALKWDFDRRGIKLQIICPGFVKTPLTEQNSFPMPFLISVDKAVRYIRRGLKSSRFEIVFPRRMAFVMKTLQLLPYPLYFAAVRKIMGKAGAPT